MNTRNELTALKAMINENCQELQSYIDSIIANLTRPNIKPPKDITDDLLWNNKSPWPFPTQNKDKPLTRVKYITLHHSAGERATTSIKYWNHLHTNVKRWPHVGYHFGIAALGPGDTIKLYQLNHIGEWTWHDARNFDTVGVCIAGDLRKDRDDKPTPEQVDLTGRLLAWLVPQLPNFVGVTFHKLIQSTACPGDIEQYGTDIIKAAQGYGLDLTGKFGVKPGRATRARFTSVLRREPKARSYKDV